MMSKKTISRLSAAILLLLTVPIPVGAQEISVEAARQTAAKFINEHAAKLPAKSRKGMMKAPPKAESLQLVYTQEDQLHESPALYVFEQPKAGGFVIASADERAYPILGYNESGTFREDSLPCCLKFMLEEYGRQIAEARKQNLPRHTEKAENESWQNIEPLLTCAWNQISPYNKRCPIDNNTGRRSMTGCVATAMAQIMYYWKWPKRGVGSHSYDWRGTTLSANFGETTYLWSLMKDKYNSYDDDPGNAVATLMYHCGVAVDMDYSSSASAGAFYGGPFIEYFNYSDLISYEYDISENTIYEELLHGRPVEICGDKEATVDGHAYICDGYNSNGFFHFNLGWGGNSDGYYKMSAVASFCSTGAIIHIAPKKEIADNYGNIYEILDGEAFLMKGSDVKGYVEIPAQVTSSDGTEHPVTTISSDAFCDNTSITSVIIPNSVTTIGDYAFSGCSGLTSITIPNSVTSIGVAAFSGTAWFNNQPDGLVYAGKVAYKYKGGMPKNTSISLKEGTLEIASSAFNRCSGLTSINIPNSVTSIGKMAFEHCSGLTSVTIPNSVTSIGDYAFWKCSGLTSVTFHCKEIGSWFGGNTTIKEIVIGKEVESIGNQAFSDCSGLTSVTIPNSVTSIGSDAFKGCSGLTSVTIHCKEIRSWFRGISTIKEIVIGKEVESIGNQAFSGCSGLTSINIPNSVTSIGEGAFSLCSGLTSINIPNSVTSIGNEAFTGCSGLKSITIPNSVTTIGWRVFYGCFGLTSVTSYIEKPFVIHSYAFSNYDATLYVPVGTVEKYKSTDGWNRFKNIVEIEIDGIEGVTVSNSNSSDSENAPMYNLSGQRVGKNYKGIVIKNGKKVKK